MNASGRKPFATGRAKTKRFGTGLLLASHLLAASLHAQNTFWINPTLGNWSSPGNWSHGIPQSGIGAFIANNGSAFIDGSHAFASSVFLGPYNDGNRGFLSVRNNGTLTLYNFAVHDGAVEILNGGRIVAATGTEIGSDSRTGQITVRGSGTFFNGGTLVMSSTGSGTLRIEEGATVETRVVDFEDVGAAAGIVTGAGSTWNIGTLDHDAVAGSVTVSNGGTVNIQFAALNNGTTFIGGAGSSYNVFEQLDVGYSTGAAHLSVSGGGRLTSGEATLGRLAASSGSATISGNGSEWNNAGKLLLGGSSDVHPGGSGSLRILSGGVVRSSALKVFSGGSVEVNNGSTLISGLALSGNSPGLSTTGALGDVIVGSTSSGKVSVGGGGGAFTRSAVIADGLGSSGVVIVFGAGSQWNTTGHMFVGNRGSGLLEIHSGGDVVSGGGAFIGNLTGSGGTAIVRDAGSSWTMSGGLLVGNLDSGRLEVRAGGVVTSAGGSIGVGGGAPPFGPTSSALVTGAGSIWNAGPLSIGGSGGVAGSRGSLRIENGGRVNASSTTIFSIGTLELGANPTLTGPISSLGGVITTSAPVTLDNPVTLGTGGAQIVVNGGSATLQGIISGSGGLIKAGLPDVGEYALTLTATNTYTGPTIVDQGALHILGSLVSPITVNDGGTLLGTGTVAAVQVNSGGALEAGILDSGFGTLTASSVSFASGGIFRWDFHSGTGAADRLVISNGGLSLNGNSTLVATDFGNMALTGAQTFTLIEKQSAGFASGNFAGYAEGTRFDLGANRFRISYLGGDGNDVTLTTIVPLVWDSGGTTDNWSDGDNWAANQAPVNGDSLTFGSGARTNPVMDSALLSVEEVTFRAGAPAFTLHIPEGAGQPQLTIAGALTNASGLEQTLMADGASGPVNSGVLTIASNTMSGPFALIARGPTGAGPNGGVIEFSGAADGVSSRVVTGPGSYFDFSVRATALRLGSIEGGGLFLMGSNSLSVGWNNSDTEFSGTLAGGAPARLEKHGMGTFILSESNTYGGGTSVFGGTLVASAPINQLGLGDVTIHPTGQLLFAQTAVAGFQTFTALGSSVAGQAGGALRFTDTASAGRITLVVEGAASGLQGGSVSFEGASNAGTSAAIAVQAGVGMDGVSGSVNFVGSSTADGASLTNRGGASSGARGGLTAFRENTSAGAAMISNESGSAGTGGRTQFFGMAGAGASQIVNEGTPGIGLGVFDVQPGRTEFFESATAGAAEIVNRGSTHPSGSGGSTVFAGNATAGSAHIINENNVSGGSGGRVRFMHAASAGSATIINRGALTNDDFGLTSFAAGTTAGSATIINEAGVGGEGGTTVFLSDAGSAHLTAQGGGTFEPGVVVFQGAATAGVSTLIATGATSASGLGGAIYFTGQSSVGSATLTARSGLVAGAPGGTIYFNSTASGGPARVIVEAGGLFEIGSLASPSVTIGSLEGAGAFSVGTRELVVGENDASTTFTGTISESGFGGSLTKIGNGTLNLNGTLGYTGKTTVREGVLHLTAALPAADLDVFGGVLEVDGDVTGAEIFVESALANFHTSQQIESLTIGDGGVVVLTAALPAPALAQAVPEPGIGALLASALLVAATPRRRKCPRRPRRAGEGGEGAAGTTCDEGVAATRAPDMADAPAFRAVPKVREGGTPSPARETRALPGNRRAAHHLFTIHRMKPLLLALMLAGTSHAQQPYPLRASVFPAQQQRAAQHGFSVAADATYVVVGAPLTDVAGVADVGVAVVYLASTGALVATLPNPSPAANDQFGRAVAVSGNRVVVGASGDDTGASNAGAAYVFDLASATPTAPIATLAPVTPVMNGAFGQAVGVSGENVVVGANGLAQVFAPGFPAAILPNPGTGGSFGSAVAVSGQRLVVGAFGHSPGGTPGAGAAYVYLVGGTVPAFTLNNPSAGMNDQFGASVAISGLRVVVGANLDNPGLVNDAGSACVYDLSHATPTVPVATLPNPAPQTNDQFGISVGISGTKIVVGAWLDGTSGPGGSLADVGRVYLYDLFNTPPTTPIQTWHNPTIPAPGDAFGGAVALAGDRVVIGAYQDDTTGSEAGAAFLYALPGAPLATPLATLTPALNPSRVEDDYFGESVGVWGDFMVVGAPGHDQPFFANAGAVYVYHLLSPTPTVPFAVLENGLPTVGADFGHGVAISGSTLVVGAPGYDAGANNAGTAYVYDLASATPTTPRHGLNNPSPEVSEAFGSSVAVSGQIAIVGAEGADVLRNGVNSRAGAAYVYDLGSSTPTVPVVTLNNPNPENSDLFGFAVAVSGSRAVVGAWLDDPNGLNAAGSAYTYNLGSGTPTLAVTLSQPNPAAEDNFGYSVAAWGNRVVVGAPGVNGGGAAYVYDVGGPSPVLRATLTRPTSAFLGLAVAMFENRVIVCASGIAHVYDVASPTPSVPIATLPNPTPGGDFGRAVAIWGDRAVVGDPLAGPPGIDYGAAHVFGAVVGMSRLEGWRLEFFGSTANAGNGADFHDFDRDGLENLLEFATFRDPRVPSVQSAPLGPITVFSRALLPPNPPVTPRERLTLRYQRSKAAVFDGLAFIADRNSDLTGPWTTLGQQVEIISDDGVVQVVEARAEVPVAEPIQGQRFMRLRVTRP